VRVISGKYKGRRFHPPKAFPSRPTTDFAKEALFSILTNRIDFEEIVVLDLFAGTGNISLEFISRGALRTTSVDISPVSCKFMAGLKTSLEIKNWDTVKNEALKFCGKKTSEFNVIFADPPFDFKHSMEIPMAIFSNNLLKNNGILIVEHDKRIHFENTTHFTEIRKYGGVEFSFFSLPATE